jgi:serine/threonine-protein phosphatase 5
LILLQIREQLDQGGSPIESGYSGPQLPADGSPTPEFIESMMDWFKDGNVLPRRIAWEIILGAYNVLKEEETLVDVEIPADQTIDV